MRWLLAVPGLALAFLPAAADATWSAAGSGSATSVADTMTNATGFTSRCTTPGAGGSTITLDWTKSADLYVLNYVITRSGSSTNTITVAGTQSSVVDPLSGKNHDSYSYTI